MSRLVMDFMTAASPTSFAWPPELICLLVLQAPRIPRTEMQQPTEQVLEKMTVLDIILQYIHATSILRPAPTKFCGCISSSSPTL